MNCVKCVRVLQDYCLYDPLVEIKQLKRLYEITGCDKYKYELEMMLSQLEVHKEVFEYFQMPLAKSIELIDRFYANRRRVVTRLYQRIDFFVRNKVHDNQKMYFVTLTLDNSILLNMPYELIRECLRAFLSSFSKYYVCNKDLGETTARLHFHGCIILDDASLDDFENFYNMFFGFCCLELCNENSAALSMYVQKLSMHALKFGTDKEYREHLIYSTLDKEDRALLEATYHTNKTKVKIHYKSVGGVRYAKFD